MRSERWKISQRILRSLCVLAAAFACSTLMANHKGAWNMICNGGTNIGQSCSTNTDCPGATCLTTPFDFQIVAINMVHLHTGKILFWENRNAETSARVWNFWNSENKRYESDAFASGSFTNINIDRDSMFCAGQAPLADGRVLIVGGHNPERGNHIGTDNTNIFDPGRFDPAYVSGVSPAEDSGWFGADDSIFPPNMDYRRWYPSVTTLADGRLLTVSGSNRVCSGGANDGGDCVTDESSGRRLTTSGDCPLNNTGSCDLQAPTCYRGPDEGQACSIDDDCANSICVGSCNGGDDNGKSCQNNLDCELAGCDEIWQEVPEIYDPFDGPKGSWSPLPSATKSIAFYPFDFVVPNDAEKNIVAMAGAEVGAGNNESPIRTWILDVDNNQNWTAVDDSCFAIDGK